MLRGIDIYNGQGKAGFKVSNVLDQIDFCICKATEGLTFVDPYCDVFVQTLRSAGKCWGFYHFGRDNDPVAEADAFHKACLNYFGEGIPVLDWEKDQSVDWVNRFVRRIHDLEGVWCWIYGNARRFEQGDVEPNCMRWIAKYPNAVSPSFADAEGWPKPEAPGLVGAWQFCSDGKLEGYSGKLDLDLFYGDETGWKAYCQTSSPVAGEGVQVLENDDYKITVERK